MSDQESINQLLDEDKYMAIVNASGWPTTKMITLINKAEFLEGLIIHEVINKRDMQITAFGKGLEQLGLLTLIRNHPETLKPVFVHKSKASITAEGFLDLLSSSRPNDANHLRVYEWFVNFIKSRDTEGNHSNMYHYNY